MIFICTAKRNKKYVIVQYFKGTRTVKYDLLGTASTFPFVANGGKFRKARMLQISGKLDGFNERLYSETVVVLDNAMSVVLSQQHKRYFFFSLRVRRYRIIHNSLNS